MTNKRWYFILGFLLISNLHLFGAAGRAKDGFLFSVLLFGILGVIIGILYLVGYLRFLIRRFRTHNGEDNGVRI